MNKMMMERLTSMYDVLATIELEVQQQPMRRLRCVNFRTGVAIFEIITRGKRGARVYERVEIE